MSYTKKPYNGKYDAKGRKIPDSNVTIDDRFKELEVEFQGTLNGMYMIYRVYKSGKVVYLRDLWKSNGDDTFWTAYKCRARTFKTYFEAYEALKKLKYAQDARIGQF